MIKDQIQWRSQNLLNIRRAECGSAAHTSFVALVPQKRMNESLQLSDVPRFSLTYFTGLRPPAFDLMLAIALTHTLVSRND